MNEIVLILPYFTNTIHQIFSVLKANKSKNLSELSINNIILIYTSDSQPI